jgi:hypothetical protein
VQVWYEHCAVKFVMILGILDLKVRVDVSSVIYRVTAVYWAPISRYCSPAAYKVNAKELNDPNKGALVSPE